MQYKYSTKGSAQQKATPRFSRGRSFWLVAGLLCALVASPISAQQDINSVSIAYTVSFESEKYGNATLGKFQTEINKTDDGYTVLSALKGQGLAAILMGSNYQESCNFRVDQGRAISNSYSGGRQNLEDYEVNFDWDERKINFSDGESLDMPKGYVVDNCNMPFAAAILKGEGLAEQPLYIVDGKKKRIRGYNLKSRDQEVISTKIGEIGTVKIVLERELHPERTITLWLSPENAYVPLKMEERRRKRTTTMMVDQINS